MNDRIESVKAKIRKLLAMAADDTQADGEIVAARNALGGAVDMPERRRRLGCF